MRKLTTIITAIALIAGATVITLYSCKKEAIETTPGKGISISQEDLRIQNLITNFKKRVDYYKENPDFKSSETMSVDSAIWYIDATLNFYYAKANHPFAVLHRDTSYFELNILQDLEATIDQIVLSYGESLSKLSQSYHEIQEENKQFIMADVRDMGPIDDTKRNLQIITVTGTGFSETDGEFGEDEAYLFKRDAIYDCYGTPSNGAPIIFETHLNNHFNPDPSGNWHWAFIGQATTIEYNYWDYQLNNNPVNYLDYKVFCASEAVAVITSVTECLEYDQEQSGIHEMQFYYDHLIDLINEWMNSGQNIYNKHYCPLSQIYSFDENNNGYRLIQHKPIILYKKRAKINLELNEPPTVE